jgi:hypothetical protein
VAGRDGELLWPLNGQCGGSSGNNSNNYWSSIGSSGNHVNVNLNNGNGNGNANNDDNNLLQVACVR